MDIRTLRYFVEVVRQQSFTRAAEKMFVTQPTISKMLRNLEDELNCTLLIRDGRRLLLTDTGQVVFQRGLAILAEFRQLEAELSDIKQLTNGVLRLGIPPMVGTLMTGPIGVYQHRYPGVEFKISEFGGLTVQQAVQTAEQIGAERTWFIHMSHDLMHEETNAGLPDTMRLAHDGLVLE